MRNTKKKENKNQCPFHKWIEMRHDKDEKTSNETITNLIGRHK